MTKQANFGSWTKPELVRLGRLADVAATGAGPNQCGGGGGCTPKS